MTDVTTSADLLAQGDLRPVAAVAQKITGKRPSGPTTWRWIRKGVDGGITLAAVPVMGQWHTTAAAFRDFLERRADSLRRPRDVAPSATDDDLRANGLL